MLCLLSTIGHLLYATTEGTRGYPLLSEWPCLPQSVWMVSIAPTEPLAIYHQSKNFAETSSSLRRPF